METKYFNHELSADEPIAIGDQYHGQDRLRDFYNQREYVSLLAEAVAGQPHNIILDGCYVTQGAGHTVNVTAGKVLVDFTIKTPTNWSSIAPPMSNQNVPMIAEVGALINQAIAGANTDGVTTNYLKIAYSETTGSSRTRQIAGGSYNCEVTPAYTLTCDDSAPAATECAIATFTTNGVTITFLHGEQGIKRIKDIVGTYTSVLGDYLLRASGTFTITLPAVASSKGMEVHIKNIGTGTITIDGNGAETIDGATTISSSIQYESYTLICNGSSWDIV